MPLYMDRHDVSKSVTAENVAQLHKEDLKIQEQFNCRGLTYWFDDIKKIAFCLVEAPDKESIQKMHNFAHGEVPNHIIEVDENLVESFLGRIEDPDNSSSTDLNIINDTAQRTLMVIRFHTISLNGINNSQWQSYMQRVIKVIGELLMEYEGRLVEHKEGYLLISFKSAYKAVQCAMELEPLISKKIVVFYDSNIRFKIGLASGMPVAASKTFFEDTTKLANRLCFINHSNIVLSTEVQNLFVTEKINAYFDVDKIYVLPFSEEFFLNTLIDFIEKEWDNPELKVEDFDIPFGMSRTQVYRKVMQLTGKSPNSFLKEYRLNRALEKINKNLNTISEIAYETGFNSLSYFSKCFSKRYDLLPTEYIKS
jgi:AraC-like DNA-binding protein